MSVTLEKLAADLTAARQQAERYTGLTASGVRAVEPAPDGRWYLCAFPGPQFLCLRADTDLATDASEVRTAAACVLFVEHGQEQIDGGEAAMLAALAERAGAHVDGTVATALAELADAAAALGQWRAAPERVVASLADLDRGIALHDRMRLAFDRYVERSEPLVAGQDTLPVELVEVLRDLELTAGRAGVSRPMAGVIVEAAPAIDAGADEIVAAHVSPLAVDS